MKTPQLEDGYTRIATELFEALCTIRIPGEARQVFDVILRKTYGWQKKKDTISLSQFTEITGINKQCIIRAIKTLEKMNLIVIQKDNNGITNYGIQKVYNEWRPLSKKITLSKKIMTVIEKDNASLSKKIHTINTSTKDTITKDNINPYSPLFENFWKEYPRKTDKSKARKAWDKIKFTQELYDSIITAVKNQIKSGQLKISEPQYIPHPTTWLNGKRWEDEIIGQSLALKPKPLLNLGPEYYIDENGETQRRDDKKA